MASELRSAGLAAEEAPGEAPAAVESERYKACSMHLDIKAKNDWLSRWPEGKPASTEARWDDINGRYWRAGSIFMLLLNIGFLLFMAYGPPGTTAWEEDETNPNNMWIFASFELFFLFFFSYELKRRHADAVLAVPALPQDGVLEKVVLGFMSPWNVWDAIAIFVGLLDCIFNFAWTLGYRFLLLLLPAMQFLRLARFSRTLSSLIRSMFRPFGRLLWLLILLASLLYVGGALTAGWLRPAFPSAFASGANSTAPGEQVEALFAGLPEAFVALFGFATAEGSMAPLRQFMANGSAGVVTAIAMLLFVVLAHLVLLNLLTAVVVESALEVLPRRRLQDQRELIQRLIDAFAEDGKESLAMTDLDGDKGRLMKLSLQELEISEHDLRKLFRMADVADAGTLPVPSLARGLQRMLPGAAERRDVLELECDMHRMWKMLAAGQENLTTSVDAIASKLASGQAYLESSVDKLTSSLGQISAAMDSLAANQESFETKLEKLNGSMEPKLDRLTLGQGQTASLLSKLPPSDAVRRDMESKVDTFTLTFTKGQEEMEAKVGKLSKQLEAKVDYLIDEVRRSESNRLSAEPRRPSEPVALAAQLAQTSERPVPAPPPPRRKDYLPDDCQPDRHLPSRRLAGLRLPPSPLRQSPQTSCLGSLQRSPGHWDERQSEPETTSQDVLPPPWEPAPASAAYSDGTARVVEALLYIYWQHWTFLPIHVIMAKLESTGFTLAAGEQELLDDLRRELLRRDLSLRQSRARPRSELSRSRSQA